MWIYEKKLMYPVKIQRPNARLAKVVMEQYGGGDGRDWRKEIGDWGVGLEGVF